MNTSYWGAKNNHQNKILKVYCHCVDRLLLYEEMTTIKNKYNVIWLDIDYYIIVQRRDAKKEQTKVYPDGINTCLELYYQHSDYMKIL